LLKIEEKARQFINDIITNNSDCLSYLVTNEFNENLIRYLINHVDSSHICSKTVDELIMSNKETYIINGILLLGYWANKYPLKYSLQRINDILSILKKIDLNKFLVELEFIEKLLKGLFLFIKAFPNLSENIIDYIKCNLKENIEFISNDIKLKNSINLLIDETLFFVQNFIIDQNYVNLYTSNTKI